jgi:hypothetical protein
MDTKKEAMKYVCKMCDYMTSRKCNYTKHCLAAKHKLNAENPEKEANKYNCFNCDYITSSKKDYNKHLLTAKHRQDNRKGENPEKEANHEFICNCGKNYKYIQGLYKHKNLCFIKENIHKNLEQQDSNGTISVNQVFDKAESLIMEIIRENQEFKNLIIEQQKENKELIHKMVEISQQPTTVNNNTNNNQSFNLNFFLNETCKDAMNIQEFLENIFISFDELMTIGNAGFVNGVSDIFIKRLRDLEVTKRPIHCTDAKRETIYLKGGDAWNKDDKENTQLKDVIEKVEKKNVISLHQWCTDNPDSRVNNTPNNLLRDKIFYQTLLGDDKNREKIIKHIVKEVTIGGKRADQLC